MVEVLNAVVCLLLMFLLAPVSVVMRNDGYWPQRAAFTAVAFILALQVAGPIFDDWLPAASGLQAAFNVVLLMVVINARREIMAMVRMTLGRHPMDSGERRRAADISSEMLHRVHGRGKHQ